jgi:FkbM family methyltransferase
MSSLVQEIRDRMKLRVLQVFERFRGFVIGPYSTAILTNTENGLILVPTRDVMVGRRLSFNGSYDPKMLSTLFETCDSSSEVLFVGAHVGSLAIPVAKKVKKVVAVEANPATYDLLRMNVLLNGLQNLEIHNFAAGDRNGEVTFLASGLNSGGSGIDIGQRDGWAFIHNKPQKITVTMRKLDDVFPTSRFDLIVMDIEGAEALALRGMSALVTRSEVLLVEVFESHLRNVAKVSNEEFLDLIGPHFSKAFILAEKQYDGNSNFSGPYPKVAFSRMMAECCTRGMANVMFLKGTE